MSARLLAVPAALVLVLAGCAGPPSAASSAVPPAPASSEPSPASPSASSEPTPASPPASSEPTDPAPAASGAETISGTVTAGVEAGCLILRNSTGSHLLLFADPSMRAAARPGTKVTVVGRSSPGLMTTCQQGVPFVVGSIRNN